MVVVTGPGRTVGAQGWLPFPGEVPDQLVS